MIIVHWTLWWESDPMCQNLGNISFVRFCSFESDLCSWRSLTFLEQEISWARKYLILGELGLGITGSTWAPRSPGTSQWTAPSRERQCERPCKNLDQNEQILEQTRLPPSDHRVGVVRKSVVDVVPHKLASLRLQDSEQFSWWLPKKNRQL